MRFSPHHIRALAAAFLFAVVPRASPLADDILSNDILARVFPGADRALSRQGQPPAWPIVVQGQPAGFVLSTFDTIGSLGFAGNPFDAYVGVRTDGTITGAWLKSHAEPIIVIGLSNADLESYVAAFKSLNVLAPPVVTERGRRRGPDAISGATLSSAVIQDAIIRSSRAVLAARSKSRVSDERTVDRTTFEPARWQELVDDGSIACRALGADGGPSPVLEVCLGLATPPRIGQNLIGRTAYARAMADLDADDHAIIILANGAYSIKGTAYVRTGKFDRLALVQGPRSLGLERQGYINLEQLADDQAPPFREIGVFRVAAGSGFRADQPWRLDVLIDDPEMAGRIGAAVVAVPYELPDRYLTAPILPTEVPSEIEQLFDSDKLWVQRWQAQAGRIGILLILLLVLSAALIFQDVLVKNVVVYRNFRLWFLAFVVVWLGWYAGAQLSVVHVLTFIKALRSDFNWEFFLIDPLSFVLWGFVAAAMLFWGRGVFCGWLSPFGALQELINEAARAARLPQITVPFAVHERLWPIKYLLFLALFAVSLNSVTIALYGAEIEPFKTVVALGFVRHWPFVVYAVALLVAGLFIERFYCRYLCPLGAALAIPARLRMFDWLKRRFQCGRSCHNCAERCTVQAIHPNGVINVNECIHCLNCQAIYFDPKACPTLAQELRKGHGHGEGEVQHAH